MQWKWKLANSIFGVLAEKVIHNPFAMDLIKAQISRL
jgi:hypothetical protein